MFTAARAPSTHRSHTSSQAYRQIGVQTGVTDASPHQLVAMLYSGVLENLHRARGALAQGDVARKAAELSRAARIVDEGLKSALSPSGGALSERLEELYAYIGLRITQANLRNDAEAIDECIRLVEPLRDAWQSIRAQVDATAGVR